MNWDAFNVVVSLITGLLGGVVVAVLNHLFTRKKTAAETRKLEAETSKIRAETEVMLREIENLSEAVQRLGDTAERVIYDATKSCSRYDFRDVEGRMWSSEENKFVGPKGKGLLRIEEGGILNIERTNTEGRFEIWLEKYAYNDEVHEVLPKNEIIAGARKLRVSCQAKTVDSKHTLHFVIKDPSTGAAPAQKLVRVSGNEWSFIDFILLVSPSIDCVLRIYDRDVSEVPSSVQIRNLRLAERVS